MCIGLRVKYPLFLSDFNDSCSASIHFLQILKYKIPWKSRHWEPSCSMRADGLMDRHDEANSRFSQFCDKRPKTIQKIYNIFKQWRRQTISWLTLILLTWRIWWASNNASRWQMEFNSAFKGLKFYTSLSNRNVSLAHFPGQLNTLFC